MSLFDLARFASPIFGAIGAGLAAYRAAPSTPAWMWATIFTCLVIGFGCYRGLMRLAIGRHNWNPHLPNWRAAAILVISFFSPWIVGAICYGLVKLLLSMV